MKHYTTQSIVTFLALISLVLVTDPFMTLMPNEAQMAGLVCVAILLTLTVGFIYSERAEDEREELHRFEASRLGYASGLLVLVVALLVQGTAHAIDPWLVFTIAIMLFVKVVVRVYDSLRK